jgi:hypothetical protein
LQLSAVRGAEKRVRVRARASTLILFSQISHSHYFRFFFPRSRSHTHTQGLLVLWSSSPLDLKDYLYFTRLYFNLLWFNLRIKLIFRCPALSKDIITTSSSPIIRKTTKAITRSVILFKLLMACTIIWEGVNKGRGELTPLCYY